MGRPKKKTETPLPRSRRWPLLIAAIAALAVAPAVYFGMVKGQASVDSRLHTLATLATLASLAEVSDGEQGRPDPAPVDKGLSPDRLPDPASARVVGAGVVEPTVVRQVAPPDPAPEGMAWIPPGRFSMGSDYRPFGDARPIHAVELDGFWMDRTPVTNEQFARFVRETGYVTVAERKPDPKDFPGVPPEVLVPGAVVFSPPAGPVSLQDVTRWWSYVPGTSWKHPEGPGSEIAGRDRHPVVQVSWEDAAAYAKWAGKRLPTEAEWEYAARGGLSQKPYAWGESFRPEGKIMANTWQGSFPDRNAKEDGWDRTAPVGSYPPNGFGLFDMAGNVWHWCADWYRHDYYARSPTANPPGPPDSFDPMEPGALKRVQRGGSFLCSDQYCSRYMPGGRGKGAVDTGSSHVGFRCVLSPPSARPDSPSPPTGEDR